MESFENIYLDLSKQPGKCKLAESGLGWKPSGGGDTFTLDKSNIGAAQWSRAAKGYELKILPRAGGVIQLDGFDQEDFERTSKAFKLWYGINLENREHALRGWNWGKADFGKAELSFNVQNRPAFEIPYSEITNTNLAGRNEVAVEFSLSTDNGSHGVNGQPERTKNYGKKAGAGKDELVEMRFYIPGTAVKKDQADGDDKSVDGEEPEELNAANLFYETLMEKAEIGEVAGDTFATFPDVLHLTPRGRFDIDMYENSLRLRGKTYDYKIQYQSIKKFFLLPKNDDTHTLITIGLDPPLRQGQTRYPFLVMQLKLDDEYNLDLNMTDELLQTRYKDKLQAHYEEPIHQVITKVFRGLSGKKVIMPSKDFTSHHNHRGIKCSIKANEGLLFCLDKSFMFVPKPATYVQIENISVITMSRVGGAVSASRTFDITMTLKGGGEHQFSNINREEQQPLELFFKAKNIRFKNEMAEDTSALIAAALDNDELMGSSDEEVDGGHRGSADEDEESVDEDFQAESESDVAEEYDSAHESSGSGSGSDSDAEMDDAEDEGLDEDLDEQEEERPKKKSKIDK
ncbi:FACT complex subunit pob3 [Coccidioides immitis RS]|uniref:FACT complex subunit POB3 n=3 Tax=Coccidioides immitis TaxID=5501 RepID=J3KDY2_COCIM|nr:FACT complex subunit pob3 [Coccidioides immitis RS]EAS33634.3 FACT complex subunit pob3 [Coccidioides immitis RS]KMP04819.1 FACT complex subunit pob3 [Coccidioides immitis RMSCC 2394]KMU78384.1 FACT complex subunit pob3 [Coccidioides immitis RMSCC 3703]